MHRVFFFVKKIISSLWLGIFLLPVIGASSAYFYLKYNTDFVKDLIEKGMENRINHDVEIGFIEAQWDIINPSIAINDYVIYNSNYEKSISVERIELGFSWLSLLKFEPVLDRIELKKPQMKIVRERDGSFSVNDITFDYDDEDDGQFSNWLLNQDDVYIIDGQISWQDKTRGDTVLQLRNLNVHYDSSNILAFVSRHEFKVRTLIEPSSEEEILISGHIDLVDLNALDEMYGDINIQLTKFELAKLRPWIDYPVDVTSGKGDLSVDISVKKGELMNLDGALNISDVVINTNKEKNIKINNLNGKINLNYEEDLSLIQVNNFTFNLENGFGLENVNFRARLSDEDKFELVNIELDEVNLGSITNMTKYFPSEFEELRNNIATLSPQGTVKNLRINWERGDEFFKGLDLKMQLVGIGFQPMYSIPGMENLSASFNLTGNTGSIKSTSKDLVLIKADTFRRPLKFNQLKGELSWSDNVFELKDITINNADFESNITAKYILYANDEDTIDLKINIPRANISDLQEYYPKQIGEEGLNWLDSSLLKGVANNTTILIRGGVNDFPFIDEMNKPDPTEGLFQITSNISNSSIEYGEGWPKVEEFDIDLMIVGSRITLSSVKGHILENNFKSFEGVIDDFNDVSPILKIKVVVDSPMEKILNTINNSPIKKVIGGVSDDMRGNGPGELDLTLMIPFVDVDSMTYEGIYSFNNSSLENPSLDLPLITEIKGELKFDTNSVSLKEAKARVFDQPLTVSVANKDNITVVDIDGFLDNNVIKSTLGKGWNERVFGKTGWKGKFVLKDNETDFTITTDLKGITINSLQDFNKQAEQSIPFKLLKHTPASGVDYLDISYGEILIAKLTRDAENIIDHGFIGINTTPAMPESGVSLVAKMNQLDNKDLDFIFNDSETEEKKGKNKKITDPLIDYAVLDFQELIIEGNKLSNAKVEYRPSSEGADIHINSNEVEGSVKWAEQENRFNLSFSKIHLKRSEDEEAIQEEIIIEQGIAPDNNTALKDGQNMSQVEMVVDSLMINDIDYGKIHMVAHEDKEGFVFDNFILEKGYYAIKGAGYWKSEVLPQKTSFSFEWTIKNIGDTLTSLGYPDLIEKGTADVEGLITWDDGPSKFDAEDFYGNFIINAKKGVIKKIKPGVAGRLVGLLSLQNLPQRLTLDFSDLFEEGFPFDKIASPKIIIQKGLLSTEDFDIEGPAANIAMKGQVDFIKETQGIDVLIHPKVSDTIAAGALVGGPLAAAAAYIAQKILDDPFDKITVSEYHITGTWDDPKEQEVGSSP